MALAGDHGGARVPYHVLSRESPPGRCSGWYGIAASGSAASSLPVADLPLSASHEAARGCREQHPQLGKPHCEQGQATAGQLRGGAGGDRGLYGRLRCRYHTPHTDGKHPAPGASIQQLSLAWKSAGAEPTAEHEVAAGF